MPHYLKFSLGLAMSLIGITANTAPNQISLPLVDSTLRSSTLPGYALAQQKCGICHSTNYISFQPPGMTLDQWTEEMSKMQHSYGAPISEEEIQLIGAYLAVEYGSANATDADVVALSATVGNKKTNEERETSSIDVQALLAANACMGCHAIDRKIVGPSFHDVAAKYTGTADAQAALATSISKGGTGKWGPMAMPPMSNLSYSQALSLAEFVLNQ